MRTIVSAGMISIACVFGAFSVKAAAIRVSPVLIDLPGSANAATIRIRNDGGAPVGVQIRVFRWVQVNGVEKLEPTRDVVASPPMVDLHSGRDYVVRVVRTAKTPVTAEESYRLLVDELPSSQMHKPGTVTLLVRHSIPVFFAGTESGPPKLSWSLRRNKDSLTLSARNAGQKRMRLSGLQLADGAHHPLTHEGGITGYVLADSTMSWSFPVPSGGLARGSKIAISGIGQSGTGQVNLDATLGLDN
jgi:fimbrial chaperone protein